MALGLDSLGLGDLGGVGGIGSIFSGFGKTLLILVPILLVAVLILFLALYIRRVKRYNIDVIILATGSDNNLVTGYDKAAIVKNKITNAELFRLRRRKKELLIPDRKFWVLNEKGRFTITFQKYSEDDYAAVEIKTIVPEAPHPEVKVSLINKILKRKGYQSVNPTEPDNTFEPIDIKDQLKKITFVPIEPDTKSLLAIKSRENQLKWAKQKPLERLIQLGQYFILAVLIFCIMFYGYNFTSDQIDKGYSQTTTCQKQAENTLRLINEKCLGGSSVIEDIPPPPA